MAAPSILDVPDHDAADKELVLQVRGPSRRGQIVRLKSKKCTIGSGPRCTLRLRARGVRPIHCLVLRGDAGTVIRSLAPDTRLNGRVFADAQLVTGDRLSVGPLEFEVIEPDVSSQARLDQQQEKADHSQKSEPREEEWNRRRIELADLAAKLGRSKKELDERERSLSRRDADLSQRAEHIDQQAEQIDRARADLESQRQEFEDQRRAWDADRAAAETERPAREPDVRFDEASPGAPETSEKVLARMGMASSFTEDEADEPLPPPPGPTRSGHAVPLDPPADSEGDQDESIDDYMARLLDRVRETSSQPNQPPPSPQKTAVDKAPPSVPVAEQEDLPDDTPPPAAMPPETAEPVPRATAPEKSLDLSAMRELANFSARAALNHHARRVLFGSVAARLLVALAGLTAGTILTWIWWTHPPNTTVLCAAAVSFVVVLLWGVEYVLLRGYAVLRESGPSEWNDNADEHAAENSRPERDAEESP